VILQECKSNYERWIAVVRDKRLELTSFTVSASSSIVNSPEKAKRVQNQIREKEVKILYNNTRRQRKSIVEI
jgi:hypothetical protein